MSLLDKALAARRQARGEELAREWLRDGRDAMQQYILVEAAQLEHVAALTNSYDAALQAGAAAGSMGALPQSAIVRLRELKAYVLALGTRGVRIDMGSLPASVRRYLEGQ
jgi:hypothetical protein